MKLRASSLGKNKIYKQLARLTNEERTLINRFRNKRGTSQDSTEIQRIMRDYFENIHATKQEYLERVDKCLDSKFPRLNQDDLQYLN